MSGRWKWILCFLTVVDQSLGGDGGDGQRVGLIKGVVGRRLGHSCHVLRWLCLFRGLASINW